MRPLDQTRPTVAYGGKRSLREEKTWSAGALLYGVAMPPICRALIIAGAILAGPLGVQAAPAAPAVRQEVEPTAAEVKLQARKSEELETVVFDVCVPVVVSGADFTETPGYQALGRPPFSDGAFATSTGIRVFPNYENTGTCYFDVPDGYDAQAFDFLLPFENQSASREADDWNPVPIRHGFYQNTLISRNARFGISVGYRYGDGSVYPFRASPQDVTSHFAAMWAAEFTPPVEVVLRAMATCGSEVDPDDYSSARDPVPGRLSSYELQHRDRLDMVEPLRGNVDAFTWEATDEVCVVGVRNQSLKDEIAAAINAPDSGWSRISETRWTRQDGARAKFQSINGALFYYIHRSDVSSHQADIDPDL